MVSVRLFVGGFFFLIRIVCTGCCFSLLVCLFLCSLVCLFVYCFLLLLLRACLCACMFCLFVLFEFRCIVFGLVWLASYRDEEHV